MALFSAIENNYNLISLHFGTDIPIVTNDLSDKLARHIRMNKGLAYVTFNGAYVFSYVRKTDFVAVISCNLTRIKFCIAAR